MLKINQSKIFEIECQGVFFVSRIYLVKAQKDKFRLGERPLSRIWTLLDMASTVFSDQTWEDKHFATLLSVPTHNIPKRGYVILSKDSRDESINRV